MTTDNTPLHATCKKWTLIFPNSCGLSAASGCVPATALDVSAASGVICLSGVEAANCGASEPISSSKVSTSEAFELEGEGCNSQLLWLTTTRASTSQAARCFKKINENQQPNYFGTETLCLSYQNKIFLESSRSTQAALASLVRDVHCSSSWTWQWKFHWADSYHLHLIGFCFFLSWSCGSCGHPRDRSCLHLLIALGAPSEKLPVTTRFFRKASPGLDFLRNRLFLKFLLHRLGRLGRGPGGATSPQDTI